MSLVVEVMVLGWLSLIQLCDCCCSVGLFLVTWVLLQPFVVV